MSVTMHIPTPLRPFVNGQDELSIPQADTVKSALQWVVSEHKGVQQYLFDEQGKIRKFVNIYVNDEDIRYLQGEETPLKAKDTISIVPSIAGGADE